MITKDNYLEWMKGEVPLKVIKYNLTYSVFQIDIEDLWFECVDEKGKIIVPDVIDCKPILNPIESLTEKIQFGGREFVPIEELCAMFGYGFSVTRTGNNSDQYKLMVNYWYEGIIINEANIEKLPYHFIEQLQKWKFDLDGFIEQGLAISNKELNAY